MIGQLLGTSRDLHLSSVGNQWVFHDLFWRCRELQSDKVGIMSDMEDKGIMGWEVARDLETERPTIMERLRPGKKQIVAAIYGLAAFFAVFLLGCWLAGNPFEATQRIASEVIEKKGWVGTNNWGIFWWVVALAVVLGFLDASAGMGYGTALTPLLLILGFDPKQIVPAVMIQQATAGIVGAFLHNEFGNVQWKFKPMSETIKLWLIIAGIGCLAVTFSITSVYAVLKLAKIWIRLYVAILLVVMGLISLVGAKKKRPYRPKKMLFFGALAGFSKGVGGGGYGPVVTVGGILSGVPVKSMMAITAISEGTVCTISIIVWLILLSSGVVIDYVLLPSMILGSIIAAIAAPYATRVVQERVWQWVVPAYCCILAAYCFWKTIPDVIAKLF